MSYATVNGLSMYYEVHGTGDPIVLLHGSLSGIGTSFGTILPELAKNRQVIAVEMQAHGRTADIDRPLRIDTLADDIAALLRELSVPKADILGYSLGAGVAMKLGLQHPDLVGKLVLLTPSYRRDGLHPGLVEGIDQITVEMMTETPFYQEYVAITADPDGFGRLLEREKELNHNLEDWSDDEVRALPPALLVIGDSDIVQPEHVVQMFRLLGGGVAGDLVGLPESRLAILPGTTHITLVQQPQPLVAMIEEFLHVAT
jgi:pimeloyl-ACP methyl ester carboxylesterase